MSVLHELKIHARHYNAVAIGVKKAELRINDRHFKTEDVLWLREWDGEEYTGRYSYALVTHCLDMGHFFDMDELNNWVMLSIAVQRSHTPPQWSEQHGWRNL